MEEGLSCEQRGVAGNVDNNGRSETRWGKRGLRDFEPWPTVQQRDERVDGCRGR